MLKKEIMAYVHQLLDQPSQWQTSQQAGPCSVPKFTNTSITVKHLLIKNKNISQSKSSLLIWHYVSYLFLLFLRNTCLVLRRLFLYFVRRFARVGVGYRYPEHVDVRRSVNGGLVHVCFSVTPGMAVSMREN